MLNVDEEIRPGVFPPTDPLKASREVLKPSGAYLGGTLLRKVPPDETQFQELFQRLLRSPGA